MKNEQVGEEEEEEEEETASHGGKAHRKTDTQRDRHRHKEG